MEALILPFFVGSFGVRVLFTNCQIDIRSRAVT